MKITHKKIFYVLFYTLILSGNNLFSQAKFSFFSNNRNDAGLSYNFFLGKDADAFGTTINGFGSGFIFDSFTGRYSLDFITFGSQSINISMGVGLAISKYRFSENLIFNRDENEIVAEKDEIQERDYGSGFFGYGKSKIVYGSIYFPFNLNISIKDLHFSTGVLIDQYLSGKFKRKFKENENKQIVVERNDNFNDYYLNKTKYGVNALIMHKDSGFGLGFTYLLTPFFNEDKGPSINETRISLTYDFSSIYEKKKADKNSSEIDL